MPLEARGVVAPNYVVFISQGSTNNRRLQQLSNILLEGERFFFVAASDVKDILPHGSMKKKLTDQPHPTDFFISKVSF